MDRESPCIDCKSQEFGCTCSRYRFWKAEMAGNHFQRRAAEAARGIKERKPRE